MLPTLRSIALASLMAGCASRACPTTAPGATTSTTPTTSPATVAYACHVPSGTLSASFAPDVRLASLVAWVTGFTCKTFVYDPSIADRTVTVVAPGELTVEAAYGVFTSALASMNLKAQVEGEVVRIVATGPAPVAVTSPEPVATADATADELAAAVAAGVKKLDDSHYEISRDLVDKVLSNPMAVAKGARVVPSVKDGKANGFKLYAIRPSSVYAQIGLANGDTIHAINGFELTSPDQALEVYTKVKEATAFTVQLTRRGNELTINYAIK